MDASVPHAPRATSEVLAGEASPLARALGSPEALASLTALAELIDSPRPESLAGVHAFLVRYRERLLSPVELPAIRDAFELARRGAARELVELDRRLGEAFGRSAFAEASRHMGRIQLRRLRPLRDRTLQRYLRAVENGEAAGWHVVVFGLLLALFSLPLRQGLVHYAARSQENLVESATRQLRASAHDRRRLRDECAAPIVATVMAVLPAAGPLPV